MKKRLIFLWFILVLWQGLFAGINVFILHSYDPLLKWTNEIQRGLTESLKPFDDFLHFTVEYMDKRNFFNNLPDKELYDFYAKKYHNFKPDVIVCSDDQALDFILKFRSNDDKSIFNKNIPVVACGINFFNKDNFNFHNNLYIIQEEISIADNLKLISRLHKNVKYINLIIDKSSFGQNLKMLMENDFANEFKQFQFVFHDSLNINSIDTVNNLTPIEESALILAGQLYFNDYKLLDISKTSEMVTSVSLMPVYTFWKHFIVPGIVGGKVIDAYYQGFEAGSFINEIFSSRNFKNHNRIINSPNKYIFDSTGMKKNNISKYSIPKNSIIINIPEYYQEYQKIVKYLLFVITFISLLVIILVFENIKRNKIQEQLSQSKILFEFISEHTEEIIWLMNQDRKFYFLTPAAEKKLGYSFEEFQSLDLEKIVNDYPNVFQDKYHKAVSNLLENKVKNDKTDVEILRYELPLKTKNNNVIWGDITIKLLPGEEKGAFWVLGAIHDVSSIKNYQTELITALKEKELLLKEVHHRVKNNLQIVSTLIQLQMSKFQDKDWGDALKDIQTRIQAISYIHQRIYSTSDFSQIQFDLYIKEISDKLISAYTNKYIDIDYKLEKIILPIELCVSLAMVYHEIFTNSVKYSDTESKVLNLFVKMYLNKSLDNDVKVLKIFIKDSGKGFPVGFSLENVQTVGLSLIRNLILSLKGQISAYNDNGAVFEISIPVEGV